MARETCRCGRDLHHEPVGRDGRYIVQTWFDGVSSWSIRTSDFCGVETVHGEYNSYADAKAALDHGGDR